MTTKAHNSRTLATLTLACTLLLPSSLYGAEGEALAIVDANGYIAPRVDAGADASISSQTNGQLLQATGSANTQVEFGASSTSNVFEEVGAGSKASLAQDITSRETEEGFFARLKLWGKMLISFFGMGSEEVEGEAAFATGTSPEVITTSRTAQVKWTGSPSLVARVYFSSTSPVVVSPESSYVTTWGMSSQEAEIEGLEPQTTYFYRIVPVGLGVTASSSSEFSFTTNSQ